MAIIDLWAHVGDNWEAERILDEARKLAIDLQLRDYAKLSMEIGERAVFKYEGKALEFPKVAMYRSAAVEGVEPVNKLATILRIESEKHGVVLINKKLLLEIKTFDKLYQQSRLAEVDLPYVKTWNFGSLKELKDANLDFPLVVKPIKGSMGRGVRKINEINEIGESSISEFIFQELLAAGKDYRVLYLGGECLGMMERRAAKDKFVSNYSMGGDVRRVEITSEVEEIVKKVANLFELDYVGVDLMKDLSGKWRVLELNSMAQFKGFEESTGVNVGQKIARYLSKKV